eukprot:415554_1
MNHCCVTIKYLLCHEQHTIDRVHDLFPCRIAYQNVFDRKPFIKLTKFSLILNSYNGHLYYNYQNKRSKLFEFALILYQEIMNIDSSFSSARLSSYEKKTNYRKVFHRI